MSSSGSIFDVDKQLAFYGAYHSNKTNILIHLVFVPTIMWTFWVMLAQAPVPSFLPEYHYRINDYLSLDVNLATIHALGYWVYYMVLEPTAALIYTPEMLLLYTTAMSYSHGAGHFQDALTLFIVSWLAQFAGHGFAEKRSPALLDNLIGALVLAPFFVHLEILFAFGYRPDFHRRIQNATGLKIAELRKGDAEKRRVAAKKN